VHKRPATGVMLVMAIRYADVNQLTSLDAPSAMAMGDWMVVMSETLLVRMKMRTHTDRPMREPRRVDSCPASSFLESDKGRLPAVYPLESESSNSGLLSVSGSMEIILELEPAWRL